MLKRPTIRLACLLAVAIVGSAACGSNAPSPATAATPSATPGGSASPPAASSGLPSPSQPPTAGPATTPDPATIYADIEVQVQALRQIKATVQVTPELIDPTVAGGNIIADFTRDNPVARIRATERMLKLLGLMPADQSLQDLDLKLLSSQVAGYYDPVRKQLFVISKSGGVGPTEEITFAHEFDHALQDQRFDLQKLDPSQPPRPDAAIDGLSDGSLARLSLPEGDATLLMALWAQAHLTAADLVRVAREASDPNAAAILASMPSILQGTLQFPYVSGLQLVMSQFTSGGWSAINGMYSRPPVSTEQVLHPDKYAAAEQPIGVSFPTDLASRLGTGWTVDLNDTFGEYQLGVWLQQAGVEPATAAAAAAGWGGDRVALVRNGSHLGLVLDTRWDATTDASEFALAAQKAIDRLASPHAMIAIDGTNRVTIFVATDTATITQLGSILGLAG